MQNQLVFVQNNQVLTNSRLVAEYLDKNHKDVLKKIDNLNCDPEFKKANFKEVHLASPVNNRKYRVYLITKEGFTLLALNYNSKKAGVFKQNFSRVANKLNQVAKNEVLVPDTFRVPKTKAEALQLAADQARQLEEQKPLVEFAETILSSDDCATIAEFAKSMNVGRNKMMQFLRDAGYLMSAKTRRNQPYSKYMQYGEGYFELTVTLVNGQKRFQPLVTSKGMLALQKVYRDSQIDKLIHV